GRDLGGGEAVALDSSAGKRSGIFDLACTLAQLAALGHAADVTQWDGTFARQPAPPWLADGKKPAMSVLLTGANYIKPRPVNTRPPVAPARTPAVAPLAVTQQEGPVEVSQETQNSAIYR